MFIIAMALLAVMAVVLKKYWNRIANWLNTDAANLVEQALGYNARKGLLKAVSTADRVFRMIQGRSVNVNRTFAFTGVSGAYKKVGMEFDVPADELEDNFLDELRTTSNVVAMDYRQ